LILYLKISRFVEVKAILSKRFVQRHFSLDFEYSETLREHRFAFERITIAEVN
jgi:hypothetical protein